MNKVKKKRAIIVNEGESPNLGDQAIHFCMESLLDKFSYSYDSYYYTLNPGKFSVETDTKSYNPIKIINKLLKGLTPQPLKNFIFRKKWKAKKEREIDRLKLDADIAIIGGGQLLNYNRTFPIAFDLWTKKLKEKEIPIYCIAIGYGESWQGADRKKLLECLQRTRKILFRDKQSQLRIKQELGLNSKLIYDVAFCISDFIPPTESVQKIATILPASFEHVIQRYNPSQKRDNYLDHHIQYCRNLSHQGYQLRIAITDIHQDLNIARELSDLLTTEGLSHSFEIPSNLEHLCEIISSSTLIYSGRMHALIIGFSYQKKCQAYLVSDKLKVFESEILNSTATLQDIKENIYNVFNSLLP